MTVAHASLQVDPRLTRLHRIKPQPAPQDPADLVRLPLTRSALIYKRLSSHEQKKKSIWSLEQQDALREQAHTDGYRDEQVIVEDRDLGISGTKGVEHRPGLAHMIELIESGALESVYVVHISRLTRDQTLIDGLELAQLFKRHNIILCLPMMRLNLRDSMHMRLYRQEIERAADEIELLNLRLGGPRRHKAQSGRYDGRAIPPGYLVDRDPASPTFDRFIPYEPHAEVVRQVFRAMIETGTPTRAARWLRQHGIFFPAFSADIAPIDMSRSSLARKSEAARLPGGIAITAKAVRSIVTNPAYLGYWLVNGEPVRRDNHAALVDEEAFFTAHEVMTVHGRGPGGQPGRRSVAPQMLSGLVYCIQHDVPALMQGTHSTYNRYLCDAGYRQGNANRSCTTLDARTLDGPIADVILNRCRFPQYADAVLAEIESEYDHAQELARRRRRELTRLEGEIETLKQTLAVSRTPKQAAIVFELIDQRQARMAELADARNSPVGRMLTAAQVHTVRAFLADLRTGWERQPVALRNELLRLLILRVELDARRDHLIATIVWRSGARQRIWIERQRRALAGKAPWTDDDDAWLRTHYTTATADEIANRFPARSRDAITVRANRLGLQRTKPTIPEKRP
jgi:DNA invertase Pin-like site-specific DNA recombinase